MFKLQDRSITAKIGLIIALFSLVFAACLGVSLWGLKRNDQVIQSVLGDQEQSLFIAAVAAEKKTRIHQRAFAIGIERESVNWPTLQSNFENEVSDLRASLKELKPLMDGEDLKSFNLIETSLNKYVDLEVKGYALRRDNQTEAYEGLLEGDMAVLFEAMDGSFDKLINKQDHDMDEAAVNTHGFAVSTLWTTLVTSFVGILGTIGGAIALVRMQISNPLARLTSAMRKLADGDTALDVPALNRKDEIGAMAGALQVFKTAALDKMRVETEALDTRRMAETERGRAEAQRASVAAEQAQVVDAVAAGLDSLSGGRLTFRIAEAFPADYEKLRLDFNGAMEKLQETMTVVSTNTAAIRSGAGEITSASDDLARRTEQQAASLEETAAALDEITATVKKTAEGSKHAREVVTETKRGAEHSGQVVRQAVEAMSGIEKSSDQIGNIIGVIDEIAFQTNLLALNAGVEAARAGEAGRGFAVVASEVRALAQRSAEAAKEIKALISASSHQVEQGVDLVGQTGQALERIVAQVNEINAIVAEIAASAQEQASGLDQVNTAVNHMDQVTQQNAAMVEESTAASHALARETEELARLIGQFEIGASGARSAAASRPAPRAAAKPSTGSKLVAAMKTTGSGGAARKPAPEANDWQEF